ncbi:MAG: DNA-directed RNA polymerase subunit beta' [Calditrichia bacterium]
METYTKTKEISQLQISLASPNSILEKSYGEVLKPETINYRSFKPEKDGLFCEKIFGPVKDYECHCGKYKRVRYRGIICDRCGVEVTNKAVRRERMGHISLAVPIVHIWYFKSTPSKIGYLLDISPKDLERIIYYESYVVVQPGVAELNGKPLKQGDLLTDEQYYEVIAALPDENDSLPDDNSDKFIAKMGGEAIRDLLRRIDVDELSRMLRFELQDEPSQQRKTEILKRLSVVEPLRNRVNGEFINRPEWMVMDVIPVIPPELRPLVPLEGGRFATSDLNDLYRRVIIRNNRLKKLIEIRAPEVILRNEKRMLQEAVDALFDNSKRGTAVRSDGNRPLKSLSDMLRGKQGRFRQNLLGKRVDYSGRSVIVVGPKLNLYECGLPKEMAVELFKPFIIRKLVERRVVKTVKSAKRLVEKRPPQVWEILEEIIKDHPVLLNRAPTLHRLGIQAFQPVLTENKALEIHPLVCAAFNADFDGDQMAVHVPLSYEAQMEAKLLMLSSHNILSPASGRPLAIPSQDMVLGCYYLTKAKNNALGDGKIFYGPEEVIVAYNNKKVDIHAKIKVKIQDKLVDTTVGRVIFNEIVPDELGFVNEVLTKKSIEKLVLRIMKTVGNKKTVEFLDNIKKLGFTYATLSGISIGLNDIVVPEEKSEIIGKALKEVETKQKQYEMGYMTEGEKYNQVIDIWTRVTEDVSYILFDKLRKHKDGFNSLYMMADSGARGSKEQIRQLAGMRGLMAKPQKNLTGSTGEIIENPITSNFFEGLSVLEYFISTHGARKGLADTALKTADAGYLTRRLVDVAQDVIVTENDCGTILGIEAKAIKDGENVIESLADRVKGRVVVDDVYDPISGELIVQSGHLVTDAIAEKIKNSAVETIKIRSVLTCESRFGTCALCYGENLATGRLVDLGEAVGVIAAQSIGEPGTQLTLRTFHIGGTASLIAQKGTIEAKYDGIVKFEDFDYVERFNDEGEKIFISMSRNGRLILTNENEQTLATHNIPYGAEVLVNDGQNVKKGEELFRFDPYNTFILAESDGVIHYQDMKENLTFTEEMDEQTRKKMRVIIESRDKRLSPQVQIVDEKTNEMINSYILPIGALLNVREGDKVRAGDILSKIPREITKTKDITGGLPRVAELFEARKPKNPAFVAEIDGIVEFGKIMRGYREVKIKGELEEKTYRIPIQKHVLVHPGDYIRAGENITDGSVAPHDILNILGPQEVQKYLVNEIQEVYRLQGVTINDKHIEIIVRQMMQKVRITDAGDTDFLENERVNKFDVNEVNNRIINKVVVTEPGDSTYKIGDKIDRVKADFVNRKIKANDGKPIEYRPAKPATSTPELMGITTASLSTESWISAASFQETTRVLTEAAVAGKLDELRGLKENVIMGSLIPAGTGLKKFKRLKVKLKEEEQSSEEITRESEVDE